MNSEGIATPLKASVRCVIAACTASAGAHAALVPQHLEHEPRLGAGFIAATVVLLAVAFVLIYSPTSPLAALATTLTLAALIGAYAVNVSAGIPWLTHAPEDTDAMGLATKAVEAAGLIFSIQLYNTRGGRCSLIHTEART